MSNPLVDAVKAAYQTYRTAGTAVSTAHTAIVNLGLRPVYDNVQVTDPQYNDISDAIDTWDEAIGPLRTTYNTAIAVQRAKELLVITTALNVFPNQWVKLTSLTGSPTTVWCGYADVPNPVLITLTAQPTQRFPNH